ncbi:MAG: glycoside hydrolase family 16 protein, partial [Bacteroidota bacterium]
MRMQNLFNIKGLGILLLGGTLMLFAGCDRDETQTVVNFTNLVWSDEFDDPNGLDTEVWNF